MFKALANGHYYAQSPKIGSIFVFTNYPCFKECPVEQAYVFGLWKRYKMDDDIAQQEIIRARGRGTKGYSKRLTSTGGGGKPSWRMLSGCSLSGLCR